MTEAHQPSHELDKLTTEKRMRCEPAYYDEVKEPTKLTLTPTIKAKMREEANSIGASMSELVESLFRSRYELESFIDMAEQELNLED